MNKIELENGLQDTAWEWGKVLQRKFIYVALFIVLISVGIFYYQQDDREVTESVEVQSSKIVNSVGSIVVDVSGAVKSPGIYEVESDMRLAEVLALAGGITNDAYFEWISKKLNFSQLLEDEQKIYIPYIWEKDYDVKELLRLENTTIAESQLDPTLSPAELLVNVNLASSTDLEGLVGIGPTYSQKIITNRPYKDIEEFKSKSGVSKATVEKIEKSITF